MENGSPQKLANHYSGEGRVGSRGGGLFLEVFLTAEMGGTFLRGEGESVVGDAVLDDAGEFVGGGGEMPVELGAWELRKQVDRASYHPAKQYTKSDRAGLRAGKCSNSSDP